MGIDASSQIIFTSGRGDGVGAEHILTKVHAETDASA
jgi:E3 ubiquitin-protein ligase RFWD3